MVSVATGMAFAGEVAQPLVDTLKAVGQDALDTHKLKKKIEKTNEVHVQNGDPKGKLASCGISTCAENFICSFGLKKDQFNHDINEGVCVEKGETRVYGELCNGDAQCTSKWICDVPKGKKPFSFQAPQVEVKICGECTTDNQCPGGRCEEENSDKRVCKDGQRKPEDNKFAKCVFPFIWKDMIFHECTNVGRLASVFVDGWCPTKVNSEGRYTVNEGWADTMMIKDSSKNWKKCTKTLRQ